MKKLNKFVIATGIALIGLSSCDDLIQRDPTGWYSESVAYSSVDNMDLYVNNLYAVLYANADIATGYIFDDTVTDLIKQSWYTTGGGAVNRFFYLDNFVTPESNFRSNWGHYTYIRQINEFIVDVNNGMTDKLDKASVDIRYAEARFLRAFAYQELTLRHGGVILRNNNTAMDGPYDGQKARSSTEECWKFIMDEYTAAAEYLPEAWEGNKRGRVTKGAALAMKARAALYAGEYDTAIEACNEVLALGKYSLVPGTSADAYNNIFTDAYNSELILPVYFQASTGGASAKQHNFNYYFAPSYDGETVIGNAIGVAATPTEEYASSFDIKVNGTYESFDWSHLAQYGNQPYENREPRFYANILYNDAPWRGRRLQLYPGGTDGFMEYADNGQDNKHMTTTGYVIRKFLTTASNINYTSINSGQYWIEMRLAEIYLIRSEAYARKNQFSDAYKDLNVIRARVGLPARSTKGDWASYLPDLAKERICELGMEGHRYWDLIRWDIAVETLDGKVLHGVKPTKNSDGSFSYEVIEVDTHVRHFPKKYTIFPIPYSEIKTNALCEQNDLWK